jgi:hypothetical protein
MTCPSRPRHTKNVTWPAVLQCLLLLALMTWVAWPSLTAWIGLRRCRHGEQFWRRLFWNFSSELPSASSSVTTSVYLWPHCALLSESALPRLVDLERAWAWLTTLCNPGGHRRKMPSVSSEEHQRNPWSRHMAARYAVVVLVASDLRQSCLPGR